MNAALLKARIEACLFVASDPIPLQFFCEHFQKTESEVKQALFQIRKECKQTDRGIELIYVAEGYQFRTKFEFSDDVRALAGGAQREFSPAFLEILSIIAYKQPISRSEIESIRGANSFQIISELVGEGLIEVSGKTSSDAAHLYCATKKFLSLFGLENFDALPKLPKTHLEFESSSPLPLIEEPAGLLKSKLEELLNLPKVVISTPEQDQKDSEMLEAIKRQIDSIQIHREF